MNADDGRLVALITHARRVPADGRQVVARRLVEGERPRGLLLETCHRVEFYTVHSGASRHLQPLVPPGGQLLEGEDVVRHAIEVAVGLDSVVVGEDQLLHQLRTAIATARMDGELDPILERLFSLALRSGRRARSWRQGPVRSLADSAWAAVERRVGSLQGRRVLVVGAGEMGRLAVRAAIGAGAQVLVASRTPSRAAGLAKATGAVAVPMNLRSFDASVRGVVVALRGQWNPGQTGISALVAGSTAIVDLSVPAAVPDILAERLGARFISADALAREEAGPGAADPRLAELIEAALAEFSAWLVGRGRETTAALAQRADDQVRAELEILWRRLPGLDPEVRDAVEAMSHHLAAQILRQPLEHLGRDVDGTTAQAAKKLFAL